MQRLEKADRTPKEELDEEEVVKDVKPLLEDGRILQGCNGAIRTAENPKELTTNAAKKKVTDMPHAKKELSPLWGLLTNPLFQIIAAVGLLLSGVLGKLLNGLDLGSLVNGILGGLGIDKLLE